MSDYREVNRNISTLEAMVPGIFDFGKPDWKAIWNQIRVTGQSFKDSRFPSKEEHESAWNKFQSLVNKVKAKQAESQKEWERKKDESARLREIILSQARSARPYDSGLADVILTIATGGVNLLLNAIMGPFDEEKQMLTSCGEQLKKGWGMLHDNKERMLGKDKGIAFDALNETKELLDRRWETYKAQRQRAWDQYQCERASKRHDWEQRMESNIRSLEERRDKLNSVLAHKERHLEELYDKLREAWSDDYRSRVSDWISEEESSIADIKEKRRNIEDWIFENKDKLRS
ncbi:MAG: hypothetical protein MN733_25480 [Nitrososphaera sp.]|nr:hypothetical protein [Nitrososphaera sp.]